MAGQEVSKSALAATRRALDQAAAARRLALAEVFAEFRRWGPDTAGGAISVEREADSTTVRRCVLFHGPSAPRRHRELECDPGDVGDWVGHVLADAIPGAIHSTWLLVDISGKAVAFGDEREHCGWVLTDASAHRDDAAGLRVITLVEQLAEGAGERMEGHIRVPTLVGVSDEAWGHWADIFGADRSDGLTRQYCVELYQFGCTSDDAQRWADAGFRPRSMLGWWLLSVGPSRAAAWRANGFTSHEAKEWIAVGASPDQARAWVEAHPPYDNGAVDGAEWEGVGIKPGRASGGWRSIGVRPDEAAAWLAAGFKGPTSVRAAVASGRISPWPHPEADTAVDP